MRLPASILSPSSDWIVGYDTGEHSDGIRLSRVIPGLLQLGGSEGDLPDGSDQPREHGWLYLTALRDWSYHPGLTVSPRWPR